LHETEARVGRLQREAVKQSTRHQFILLDVVFTA
jgi:hypothetical protein